jgi:hypothetical protein
MTKTVHKTTPKKAESTLRKTDLHTSNPQVILGSWLVIVDSK